MLGVEGGEGFVEFLGKGRGADLGLWGREVVEVFDEPISAGGGEGAVDFFFVVGGIFYSFLVVNRAGVHGGGEFHNRDGEGFVAV